MSHRSLKSDKSGNERKNAEPQVTSKKSKLEGETDYKAEVHALREKNREYQKQIEKLNKDKRRNSTRSKSTRQLTSECSSCKQISLRSKKELQNVKKAAEKKLKLITKDHTDQLQRMKRDHAKATKEHRSKINALQLQVKQSSAKGKRMSNMTSGQQESRLNRELSRTKKLLQKANKENEKLLREQKEQRAEDDEGKKKEYEQELNALSSKLSSAETELSVQRAEIEDLSKKVEELEAKNWTLSENEEGLSKKVQQLERLTQSKQKSDDVSSELQELNDLKTKLSYSNSELTIKRVEVGDLSKRVELLEEENGCLLKYKEECSSMTLKLQEMDVLSSKLSTTESELAAEKVEVEDLSEKLVQVEKQNEILLETKQKYDDTESKLQELQLVKSRLENELSAKNAHVDDLYTKMHKLEQENNNFVGKESIENIVSKVQELVEVKARLTKAESNLSAKCIEVESLSQQLEQQNRSLLESKQQCQALSTKLQEQDNLNSTLSKTRRELESMSSKMTRAQSELSARNAEVEDLYEQVHGLKEQNEIKTGEVAAAKNLSEKVIELEQKNQGLAESKQKCESILNSRLFKTECELTAKKVEVQDLADRIQRLEGEKSSLIERRRNDGDVNVKLEELQVLNSSLTSKESELRAKNDEVENELLVLNSRLSSKESELLSKNAEVAKLYERVKKLELQTKSLQQSKQKSRDLIENQKEWLNNRDEQLRDLEQQLEDEEKKLNVAKRKNEVYRLQHEKISSQNADLVQQVEKAEAAISELRRGPSIILSSKLMPKDYAVDGNKRNHLGLGIFTNKSFTKAELSNRSKGLSSTCTPLSTNNAHFQPAPNSESGFSERPARDMLDSELEHYDLQRAVKELSGLAEAIDTSILDQEVKPEDEQWCPGQREESPFTQKFGSGRRRGNNSSYPDYQNTHSNTSVSSDFTVKERSASISTRCSLEGQPSTNPNQHVSPSGVAISKTMNSKRYKDDFSNKTPITAGSGEMNNRPSFDVGILTQKIRSLEVVKDNMEQELTEKLKQSRESEFTLTARVTTLEEELRGKDSLLIRKSDQLRKYAAMAVKYKSKMNSPKGDESNVIAAEEEQHRHEAIVKKFEEVLHQKTSQLEIAEDHIAALETKNKKRSQKIVQLCNKIEYLQQRISALQEKLESSEESNGRWNKGISSALQNMENAHGKLFELLKNYSLDLGHLLQELQRRNVDLKYYVAESSSDGYFEQYSLKSLPVQKCLAAMSKKITKHPKELFWFQQCFMEAINAILNAFGRKRKHGATRTSKESKTSRIPRNSLHYILQNENRGQRTNDSTLGRTAAVVAYKKSSSVSSLEILPCLPYNSSSNQRNSHKPESKVVNDDYSPDYRSGSSIPGLSSFRTCCLPWRTGTRYSDSHSGNGHWSTDTRDYQEQESETESDAEPSVHTIYTSARASKVVLDHRMSSGKNSKKESYDKNYHSERTWSKRQTHRKPKSRTTALQIFVDKAADAYQTENSMNGYNHQKRIVSPAIGHQRRHQKDKTVHGIKRARTAHSKNALLEGLGFSSNAYKE